MTPPVLLGLLVVLGALVHAAAWLARRHVSPPAPYSTVHPVPAGKRLIDDVPLVIVVDLRPFADAMRTISQNVEQAFATLATLDTKRPTPERMGRFPEGASRTTAPGPERYPT